MLKLEPTEAEKVLVPQLQSSPGLLLAELAQEMDALLRKDGREAALAYADVQILQKGLGLDAHDCNLLRRAAEVLQGRRYSRSPLP
jgi:hypothetical protein